MGPSVILKEGMIYGVSDGVAVGLGYWLFVALLQGVSGAILDEHLHIMPNQGIRLSGHNGLFMGLIGACVSGVFAFVAVLLRNMLGDQQHAIHNRYVIEALGATLLVGLAGGLIVSLLNGWLAYIRHVVLRILLLRTGAIPSHYPDFLDEAAACILLRKIGGNYIFIHRLVLDHFAKATTQDLWGQQQVAASQQLAWGMQASASAPVQQGQQAPDAFGVSSPPAFAGWGQPQQADPWANQAASPVTQPNGLQAAGSSGPSWQQGNPGTQGGVGFAGNEPDKTMLCPGRALQQSGIIGYVQVKEGKEPGRIYEIRKESLSIGRRSESDIFLENPAVSRLHASIVNMGNGTYALKDEGSANGTKVNDQLVDKFKTYPLQEGDQIQLGQTILVFARH
jgi:hypothetical protein